MVKGHLEPETKFGLRDLREWLERFPDADLALCAGKNGVYALDFDIDHPKIAKKFRKLVKSRWPNVVIRSCNPPRFAILFRAAEDLRQLSNGHSVQLKSPKGKLNQIELMGNRIITMYGKHRTTHLPYRWPREYSPLRRKVSQLDELCVADVQKIFDLYERHRPTGWDVVGQSSFRRPKPEDTFAAAVPTRKVSTDEIKQFLSETSPDVDYDTWIAVGMALNSYYDGKVKGFEVWDRWSSRGEKYSGQEELRYKYSTFTPDGGVTFGSLIKKVERAKKPGIEGLTDDDLVQFALDNWVLVEKPNEVADLSRNVGESMMTTASMKSSASNKAVEILVAQGKSGEQLPKRVKLFDVWMTHPDRKVVHDYRYVPRFDRILSGNQVDRTSNLEYYNTYKPPSFELVPDTDLLHHFTDHMKYLFKDNYEMAVNWFAQILQEPSQRYRVALHSISLYEGTGRGWLVTLFNELYGDNVTTVGSLDDMFRPGAKNGYLHQSVMVTVNEMSCSALERFEVMNKLKTMLSDDYQSIDIKYGTQSYKTRVFTRLFGQANGITDVAIDEDDTRLMVCLNEEPGKDEDYYDHLYGLIRGDKSTDFLNQVYTFLMQWKLNYNWLRKAPMTKDKIKVIRACKSPTGLAMYDFRLLVGDALFTHKTMDKYLSYKMATLRVTGDNMVNVVSSRELNYIMKQQMKVSERVNVGGKSVEVCSFKSQTVSRFSESQIKTQLVKSRKLVTDAIKNLK